MNLFVKDPDSRIDYRTDWSGVWPDDVLIVASSWTVSPVEDGGLTVVAASLDDRTATATLTEGLAGASYALTNRVTLSTGEIDERSVGVRVEQR